jgi:hypothetical protein
MMAHIRKFAHNHEHALRVYDDEAHAIFALSAVLHSSLFLRRCRVLRLRKDCRNKTKTLSKHYGDNKRTRNLSRHLAIGASFI